MSEDSRIQKSDIWKQAFPFDEARRAATFLYQTWNEMAKAKPQYFNPSIREDKLTERLHYYIDCYSSSRARLTGFWINENSHVKIDANDKITERTRKDITYLSNSGEIRLVLIFEFKKLAETKSSRRAYAKHDGMQRFIDCRYAEKEPLAAMAAMVIGNQEENIKKLKDYLYQEQVTKELRFIKNSKDELISAPSAMFPGIATFDTEHYRLANSNNGRIIISHFFLPFSSS